MIAMKPTSWPSDISSAIMIVRNELLDYFLDILMLPPSWYFTLTFVEFMTFCCKFIVIKICTE